MKKLERNLTLFTLFYFFSNMMIIGPVLIPFLKEKGLNYSEIFFLQSIFSVAVLLFEVPTGVIADKISRKFSLILASIFMALGLLMYIVFDSFFAFALAEIVFGLGITFSSGADSSLLFESLSRLGKQKEYQRIEGRSASMLFTGQAFGSVLCGYLYVIQPCLPFVISFFFLITSVFIAFFFVEPDREKTSLSYRKHILKGIKITAKNKRVLWAAFFAITVGFAFKSSYPLYEPYFTEVKLDIIWFGWIFFIFNITAAISSSFILKKISHIRPRKVLLSIGSLLGISYLLPAIFTVPFSIVFLTFQQIYRGLFTPTIRFYVNRHIEDEQRATVISIVSMLGSLSFAVFGPLVGAGTDIAGIRGIYFLLGLFVFSSLLALYVIRFREKRKKAQLIKNKG